MCVVSRRLAAPSKNLHHHTYITLTHIPYAKEQIDLKGTKTQKAKLDTHMPNDCTAEGRGKMYTLARIPVLTKSCY